MANQVENLPWVFRYTNVYVPYLNAKKPTVEQVLAGLQYQNTILKSLLEDVNHIAVNSERMSNVIYQMFERIENIRTIPIYEKDRNLKHQQAKYLMMYHELHAKWNKIHSTKILFLNEFFDDWSAEDLKSFQRTEAIKFVNNYRENLSKGRTFGGMEGDIVLSQVDKFIAKFNLQ